MHRDMQKCCIKIGVNASFWVKNLSFIFDMEKIILKIGGGAKCKKYIPLLMQGIKM